jgi:hypothetical protein
LTINQAVRTGILHSIARVLVTPAEGSAWDEGVDRLQLALNDPSMPPMSRPQQRYDHRLRQLVQRTRDVSIATSIGCPRSTAREWLGAAPRGAVSLDAVDLTKQELRAEIVEATATHRETGGAASLVVGPGARLRVEPLRRTPAERIGQAADSACRRSGSQMHALADHPPVPAPIAESVSCMVPTARRRCARRSVVLSPCR